MPNTFTDSALVRDTGAIDPDRLNARLRVTASTLSTMARVHRNTLQRNPYSPLVQERLGQIVKIIGYAGDILGDEARAIAWFRFQPLAGFDRKTAEDLVSSGEAEAVLKHLDTTEQGGFA